MADPFLPNFKQSFSLADLDPNTDFLNNFPWLNPSPQEISGLNLDCPMGFPHDNIPPQLPECPGNLESFPGFLIHEENNMFPPVAESIISSNSDHKDRKRKGLMDVSTPESSCAYSSPQVSDNGSRKTHRARRGKKVRVEDDKPREVIHVRAKRGQATDSHSLAERVRRKKINERLRCLQDIVPGCYKSMGMALMLDEIINYVQSLQNQVEFLSTRLAASSMSYNFNSETDAMETMQRAKTLVAMKVQNASIRGLPSAQFVPLGQNFGC